MMSKALVDIFKKRNQGLTWIHGPPSHGFYGFHGDLTGAGILLLLLFFYLLVQLCSILLEYWLVNGSGGHTGP